MTGYPRFTGALLVIVAAAAWAGGEATAKACREWTLTTDYLFQRLEIDDVSLGGHIINLSLSLDEKGGNGTLTIDPNIQKYDLFGDESGNTEIATRSMAISLAALTVEDPANKGRRLYEIKADKLKGRLFLVAGANRLTPVRLLVAEKDGVVKHVFPLRESGNAK